MALPVPNLDDRRFQDLVDDAKRLVQQRCPEWSDHNVSDPGVTLIELFAWMTDQLLYRLNRVPDRNYVKFLELVGMRLFPATPARTDVTFWLSAPQPNMVRIPGATEVATPRTQDDEAISFTTLEELAIVPTSLAYAASTIAGGELRDHSSAVQSRTGFFCFDAQPKPGDELLVGLTDPAPSCAVVLRVDAEIEGVGVDPLNPPLAWEAWDGDDWVVCDLDEDETGGLNRPGDVIVHVPASHTASILGNLRAGWLRCRVTTPTEGQSFYSASPKITSLEVFTIGGTTGAANSEPIDGEVLGLSEGVPAQRFTLRRRPVAPADERRLLEVATADGWEEWTEVPSFADSGPSHRHFVVDAVFGEIAFGPAVREPDGSLSQYGAVPPKGSVLRLPSYRVGGGATGNVARGALSVLKSSIPYVSRVENRRPARGGVDAEDIENAKVRGPILLRTGSRAVTAEDYEQRAREAAPDIARVRCIPASDGAQGTAVRVLVVPAAAAEEGRIRFDQLVPRQETVDAIARYLDERRIIGTRVAVEPPSYQGVTVVARLRARARAKASRLQTDAVDALNAYLNPVSGGPDANGWPFGRPVVAGEIFSVLQALPATAIVEEVRLFAADPTTGERGKAVDRIELDDNALVFSYEHRVKVEE
ncbi:MAG: putative baseplate assembly protein [Gaiellaceae bacterium]